MDFNDYISTLTLDELREHLNILSSAIVQKQSVPSHNCLMASVAEERDIKDYVTYQDRFLDSVDIEALMSECMSFGFDKKAKKDCVQNKFISMLPESYNWDSAKGPVVNNPIPMQNFPAIQRIMTDFNTKYGYSLNCSLVSFYKNGKVRARLHSDDESELDHTQPIVVVSLGAVRTVEFVDKAQESFRHNALSLHPSEGSLYVMHAGCQQSFQHRVRMNKKVKDFRISLSFRSFVRSSDSELPKPPPLNLASSPVRSDASFATCGSEAASPQGSPTETDKTSPVIVKPLSELVDFDKLLSTRPVFKLKPTVPPPVQATSDRRNISLRKGSTEISSIHSSVAPGYSPFPSHVEHTVLSKDETQSSEKVCVIFGTSITEHVSGPVMSKKNRTVVNVSSSGANINDIRMMANDFHQENLRSIHKIDKIVVSVGTNDIKWYNCYARNMRRDMKPKLVLLVKELKQLFPSAQIYFHTVLPMRVVYKYTAASVHQFNNLLYEVCSQYNCFFFDCFARFLDHQGNFYSRALFRDNWHLNNAGLKVLYRALKFMIYGNLFNPLPRYSFYSRSYPC